MLPASLSPGHREALEWFREHAGKELPFSELQLGGLTTKAKGIFKPAWSPYALSVRHVPESHYGDTISESNRSGWSMRYAAEAPQNRSVKDAFGNRVLLSCMRYEIPVGILIRLRPKPDTTYREQGLARVSDFDGSVFTLIAYGHVEVLPDKISQALDEEGGFDPTNLEDERALQLRQIAIRCGQPRFRAALLATYEGKCAITECAVSAVLEAAPILPYRGKQTNHVTNSLLLRADIHTLFDLGKIAIDEGSGYILVCVELQGTEYEGLADLMIRSPNVDLPPPNTDALAYHRKNSNVQTDPRREVTWEAH